MIAQVQASGSGWSMLLMLILIVGVWWLIGRPLLRSVIDAYRNEPTWAGRMFILYIMYKLFGKGDDDQH